MERTFSGLPEPALRPSESLCHPGCFIRPCHFISTLWLLAQTPMPSGPPSQSVTMQSPLYALHCSVLTRSMCNSESLHGDLQASHKSRAVTPCLCCDTQHRGHTEGQGQEVTAPSPFCPAWCTQGDPALEHPARRQWRRLLDLSPQLLLQSCPCSTKVGTEVADHLVLHSQTQGCPCSITVGRKKEACPLKS